MSTEIQTHAAPSSSRTIAARLLTVERVLMGVVLLAVGVSGILGLLPDGAARADGPGGMTSLLAKAGFFFPLLKGAEVLLEQYLAASAPRG